MTPTPRTDLLELENIGLAWGDAQDAVLGLARELERELSAERALADRLLAIAEKAVSDHEGTLHCNCDCKCSGRRIANDNAEALAAWKEARGA